MSLDSLENAGHEPLLEREDSGSEGPTSRLSRLSSQISAFVPEEGVSEFTIWWSVVWPTFIFYFAQQSQTIVDLSFLGHLEGNGYTATDYLAASSTAGILFETTIVIFTRGFVQVLSVLCSQAYGSGNHLLMGRWLQTVLFVCAILSLPMIVMWWYAAEILDGTIGIDHRLTGLIRTFSRYSILRIYPQLITQSLNKFCVSQQIVLPLVVISVFSVLSNVYLNHLFIYTLGLGFKGSPLATSASAFITSVITVVYIFCFRKDVTKKAWPGMSCSSLVQKDRLKEVLKQGLPLTIATMLEDFQVQLICVYVVRMAQKHGTWMIATHNGLLTFFLVMSAFQYGTMGGTSVRCAHHIGNQDADKAKLVVKLALAFSSIIAFFIALFFIFGRTYIPHVYSNDPKVWEETGSLLLPVGIGYFFLSIYFISMATLDAQGRPMVVAVSFFVGAWLVCIPLATVEAFVLDTGLQGQWYAMITGYTVTTFVAGYGVYYTNWSKVLEDARARNTLSSPVVGRSSASMSVPGSP